MAVRNCIEIGENCQKIMSRLLSNQTLLKLLYYTDKDPYSQEDLTEEQIQKEVFNKLVEIIPRTGPRLDAKSNISIRIVSGVQNRTNNEFVDIIVAIEVFVPLTQWFIKDVQLRPFAIMGEIQKSLCGKTINGLGRMDGGDFQINFLTNEMAVYEMVFDITNYD